MLLLDEVTAFEINYEKQPKKEAQLWAKKESNKIYGEYIRRHAPKEVNLPGWVRNIVSLRRNRPTQKIFVEVKDQCCRMLADVIANHFLNSDEFGEYKIHVLEGASKPPLHFLAYWPCCRMK